MTRGKRRAEADSNNNDGLNGKEKGKYIPDSAPKAIEEKRDGTESGRPTSLSWPVVPFCTVSDPTMISGFGSRPLHLLGERGRLLGGRGVSVPVFSDLDPSLGVSALLRVSELGVDDNGVVDLGDISGSRSVPCPLLSKFDPTPAGLRAALLVAPEFGVDYNSFVDPGDVYRRRHSSVLHCRGVVSCPLLSELDPPLLSLGVALVAVTELRVKNEPLAGLGADLHAVVADHVPRLGNDAEWATAAGKVGPRSLGGIGFIVNPGNDDLRVPVDAGDGTLAVELDTADLDATLLTAV